MTDWQYSAAQVAEAVGDTTVECVFPPETRFRFVRYFDITGLHVVDQQNPRRLESIRELGDPWPAIVVEDDIVVDGSHRVTVARERGQTTLRAYVAVEETRPPNH